MINEDIQVLIDALRLPFNRDRILVHGTRKFETVDKSIPGMTFKGTHTESWTGKRMADIIESSVLTKF